MPTVVERLKYAGGLLEGGNDSVLDACEEAGINMARHKAYLQMMAQGFRTDYQGVAMQRPNEPGYNRPGVYVIDDRR